jgi:hypothetical protein
LEILYLKIIVEKLFKKLIQNNNLLKLNFFIPMPLGVEDKTILMLNNCFIFNAFIKGRKGLFIINLGIIMGMLRIKTMPQF